METGNLARIGRE
jgi:hypothetical protein